MLKYLSTVNKTLVRLEAIFIERKLACAFVGSDAHFKTNRSKNLHV